jgi:hypothetical protein
MKHSNFENELNEIRRRAVQELKEALAAHNGRYDFTQFEFTPIVDNEKVCEARMFTGEVFIETEERHLDTEDLTIEDILQLTAFVAETDDVDDVSGVYPVPVTWVDRDDIESADFDASGITQDDLVKISEQMQNSYLYSGQFIEDVQYACKQCGLKEKED